MAAPLCIYLAGPEVFFPDAAELGNRKKEICAAAGFAAAFPMDVTPPSDLSGPALALAIHRICIDMMDRCDLIVANMTPFRGVSMDVGTAVEMGYMSAQGKPVFGYSNDGDDYATRVAAAEIRLEPDELVEDVGFVDNLMCEASVLKSGLPVVRADVVGAARFRDLSAFEACIAAAEALLL